VINKMNVCMALIVLLSASALSQSKDSRIGDDYAKAALRAVIYTNESGITPERASFFCFQQLSCPHCSPSAKKTSRENALRLVKGHLEDEGG